MGCMRMRRLMMQSVAETFWVPFCLPRMTCLKVEMLNLFVSYTGISCGNSLKAKFKSGLD